MDRAPLDLFAFSVDEKENASKAAELESKVEADGPLVSGEILLVVANKETLLERQLRRGRIPTTVKGGMSYDGESLQKQREELEETYPGARVYSSDECDVLVLAKRVVADVIFSDYNPLNMSGLNQSRKAAIPD